jgi:hypothetical protein
MGKLKIIELVLTAAAALVAAAKAVVKFIGCIGKMKPQPATG